MRTSNAKGKHWKLSQETKDKMRASKTGAKAYNWKGDNCGYRVLHLWVSKQLGKPKYCEHCKSTDKPHRSYQWANISKAYKRDITDWMRLCVPCHIKYDKQ